MIYDIYNLSENITRSHASFGGRRVSQVWVFRKLMEAKDFLSAERTAKSVNFDAELLYYDNEGQHNPKTTVTISLADDPWKLEYVERVVTE